MDKSLDYWRRYFSGASADIWDIIENAVIVAALDYPNDFKLRRDHIAELLFTCKLTKYVGYDRVKVSEPRNGSDGEFKNSDESERGRGRIIEEPKVNCCGDANFTNVSYGEAEALNDEIEEESQLITEVCRIKGILDNHGEEAEITLFDSLRRLQLMDLSVGLLKATEILKSVNGLKKHRSKKIKDLVHTLIEGWITLLDSWMNATAAIAENTSSESMKISTTDFEEGLPCPPLDEGALFGHSIELSEFFDGMDDDGNPRNLWDANNNRDSGRKPPLKDGGVPVVQQQQQLSDDLFASLENKVQQTMEEETVMKKEVVVVKPDKPARGVTRSTRLAKTRAEQKVNNQTEVQIKRDAMAVQKKQLATQDDVNHKHREQQSANVRKKPVPPQREKVSSSDKEALIQVKIEATKRKLQERYQEAASAKKQRTIQVVELHDLPKQAPRRNQVTKPGHYNHSRHRANGRN